MTPKDDIAPRLERIKATIPAGVTLVAVSKFHPAETLMEAYQAGQRVFAESRVQELLPKIQALPADIQWHFIGHLQTNKVKQLVGKVALIESVDSQRLLDLIDKESAAQGTVTRVLLEAHVAREETKTGWSPEHLLDYFDNHRYRNLKATHLCGLMGMATNTTDEGLIAADFEKISALARTIRGRCPDLTGFDILSMGMSDDYPLAIRHGSTMVRIGTAIFGARQY